MPGPLGFVVCPSFQGATLLALFLNNHSEISALADANPSRLYDQVCSCGKHVSACEYWQTITASVDADRFSDLDTLLPILPRPLERYRLEGRELPIILPRPEIGRAAGLVSAAATDVAVKLLWRKGSRAVQEYITVWNDLYGTTRSLHGTSVIVDGSKSVRKVQLFARELEGIAQVSVIHLVRDPRGFVASWFRHHGRSGVRGIAWRWVDLHRRMMALESVVPYLRMRYEDLAADPEVEVTAALDFLGLPNEPVVGPPRFQERNHLMGNEMLFGFDGTTYLDERWRKELTPEEQDVVLATAGELAQKFGYT